jgi:hypothetical protein
MIKKLIFKIFNTSLLTILSGLILCCGPLFLLSLVLTIKYLLEGNWDKFYEFLIGLIISFGVIIGSFFLGGYYRSKTKNYSDPNDTTWFDSYIKKN